MDTQIYPRSLVAPPLLNLFDDLDFAELKQLIEINSHTSTNKAGVDASGELMQQWLQAIGFNCERFKRAKIGDHWLFTTPRLRGRKILLVGHLDTVFTPHTFTDFNEDDDWIYGPGVCDMKGGNYLALCALRRIYAQRGQIHNIDFLLVSDEETGSDDSKHLSIAIAKNYDLCFDFEAAGAKHEIVTGRKGVATWKIILTGKAAHAGNCYSQGQNANEEAAQMLLDLQSLTDLKAGTTVNVGTIKGGIGVNTIAPIAELMVEARFTNDAEGQRVINAVEARAQQPQTTGIKTKIIGGLQRDVMTPTPQHHALIAELALVLGYNLTTEQRGGVSDANIFAGAGVTTIDGLGPYGDGDHTIHERASKASFARRLHEVTTILDYLTS